MSHLRCFTEGTFHIGKDPIALCLLRGDYMVHCHDERSLQVATNPISASDSYCSIANWIGLFTAPPG